MDFEFKGQPIRVPWQIQVQVFDTVANKGPMHYVDRSDDRCTILWFPLKNFLEISCRGELLASAERGLQTLVNIATYKAVVPTLNGYYEVLIPR